MKVYIVQRKFYDRHRSILLGYAIEKIYTEREAACEYLEQVKKYARSEDSTNAYGKYEINGDNIIGVDILKPTRWDMLSILEREVE